MLDIQMLLCGGKSEGVCVILCVIDVGYTDARVCVRRKERGCMSVDAGVCVLHRK